jgi:hypothetical protein
LTEEALGAKAAAEAGSSCTGMVVLCVKGDGGGVYRRIGIRGWREDGENEQDSVIIKEN